MPNFKLTTDVIEKTYTSIVSKSFAFPVELNIKKYQFDEIKYPKDIISELRRLPKKKKEEFKNDIYRIFSTSQPEINTNHLDSSISKLLYLMVWKQGDLGKFDHIVEGMRSSEDLESAYDQVKKPYVFYQFGRHIIYNEPLVDQHSIRSFVAFVELNKIPSIDSKADYKSITESSKITKDLIIKYVKWVKKITNNDSSEIDKIDKLMFCLGKYLKDQIV
jgi:hypothetical protein